MKRALPRSWKMHAFRAALRPVHAPLRNAHLAVRTPLLAPLRPARLPQQLAHCRGCSTKPPSSSGGGSGSSSGPPAGASTSTSASAASASPASASSASAASASASTASATAAAGATPSHASIAASRLRSPVTWLSATATLVGLYGLYEYQKQRQATAVRAAGKPDLGGPFSLVDADGNRVTSESLEGRWTLLYFGFTKCPDICPDEMNKVTDVLRRLDARGQPIQPVFITIDPARDTRARLKSYFAEGGFHERFLPLTGTHEEVRKACRAYRVYFTKPTPEEVKRGDYLLDHSIISYLVDPEGEFADYYGKSLSGDEMHDRVSKLMREWESQKWWDSVLPAWLATGPTEGQKAVLKASKAGAQNL